MINMPRINQKKTGENITKLREKAGLSVKMLADKFGFESGSGIYAWEKGNVLPQAYNLVALAYIFDVKIEDILVTEF